MLLLIKAMKLLLGNIEDILFMESDPVMYAVFINEDVTGAGTAFDTLYTRGRKVLVRNPFLRDPAFLIRLQDALIQQYGKEAAPDVWRLSGVQKHRVIEGTLRPVKEWRK